MEPLKDYHELRTAFYLFDKDKNGFISREELYEILTSLGHDCQYEDIDDILKTYTCEEGVSFESFVRIATEKKFYQKKLHLELTETFKTFDRDNVNYISITDLRYILKNFCSTLSNQEIDNFLKDVDVKGDGQIDFEAIVNLIM